MITENLSANNWAQIITEEYHIEDKGKLSWVAEYAHNHEVFESFGGLNGGVGIADMPSAGPMYATPMNTVGMGNPMAPSYLQGPSAADFRAQTPGSGDIPMSTLPMALNVALYTIGLELVPVVPSKGPWALLSYMDWPYAGGKLGQINETAFDGIGDGRDNKPMYVKIDLPADFQEAIRNAWKVEKQLSDGAPVLISTDKGNFYGLFKGFSRLDGKLILQTVKCLDKDNKLNVSIAEALRNGAKYTAIKTGDVATMKQDAEKFFADASNFDTKLTLKVSDKKNPAGPAVAYDPTTDENMFINVDFVSAVAEFMDGFANFFDDSKEPMSRAQNETGTGNTIGLRLFSKWIQMGSYEVTGTVTRQQLQDLPLYGVDAVAKVMEVMQTELQQHINARILDRVFELGTINHDNQLRRGASLDLHFSKELENPSGNDSSFENLATRQRRVATRILAASNLINVTGRRGRGDWAVMSARMATALQDNSMFAFNPIKNSMVQDTQTSIYNFGTLAGIKIYVDPYMSWDDTRICVGRKGDANSPGVIFMPYILADQVSITAEGTMAPKMLVNSRFAIVEAGFYPELMYYTMNVTSDGGYDII